MNKKIQEEAMLRFRKMEVIEAICTSNDIDILALTLLACGKGLSSKKMLKANLEFCGLKQIEKK